MNRIKILTLDDHEGVQLVYKILLEKMLCQELQQPVKVFPAATRTEAVLTAQHNFGTLDAILFECRVSGSGLYFLSDLRSMYARNELPFPPAMLVTTYPSDNIKRLAQDYGIREVIGKPFEYNRLLSSCRQLLEGDLTVNKSFPELVETIH